MSKTSKDIASVITEHKLPALKELPGLPAEEQMQAITTARQFSTAAQVYVGKALASLKATVKHGEYEPLLEAHGWNPKTARRYMQFAEFSDHVAKVNSSALSHLDMTRWMVIRSQLDDQALSKFLQGEEVCGLTLIEADEKGSRELKLAFEDYKKSTDADLQAASKEIARLNAKLEITGNDLAEAREQLSQKFSDLPFDPWVSAVREESTVHGDTASRAINGLALALDQVQKHTTKSLKGDALAEYRAAATQVYHQLIGVLSATKQLVDYAHSFIPVDVIEHFDVVMPLTDEELEARLAHRDRLAQNEEVLEQIRAKQRSQSKKQGRGRPKGTAAVYEG